MKDISFVPRKKPLNICFPYCGIARYIWSVICCALDCKTHTRKVDELCDLVFYLLKEMG
jgi:hypothetical protein